jgi:hypothetical protein
VIDRQGRVDVLVNDVGVVRLRLGGFLGTSDEEFAWARTPSGSCKTR